MRKVTKLIAEAFKDYKKLTIGNTMTDGQSVFLHGNRIAWREDGTLYISMCGWPTVTTRERLDGILDAYDCTIRICQRKGEQGFTSIHPEFAHLYGAKNFQAISPSATYPICDTL